MAARRLVLNGLTAEVGAGAASAAGNAGDSPDEIEFYHELELYRQLLALPAPASAPAPAVVPARRARTPDPAPTERKCHDARPRRSRTPAPRPSPAPCPAPAPAPPAPAPPAARTARCVRGADVEDGLRRLHRIFAAPTRLQTDYASNAPTARAITLLNDMFTHHTELDIVYDKYLGSFPVGGGEVALRTELSSQLQLMKENGRAVPVLVVVALSGVKVCNPEDQSVRMSHATRRILFATCEAARALFALVAREPRADPPRQYCHAFETDSPEQAEELNTLVGDAFRMAFASQLQPSAPLWCKELSGSECGSMGVRAPDSLPGLTHHYPHCGDRSPMKCDSMGVSRLMNEPSPSSSEESNSPTELNCYRRLGERQPLMKRLAMGLSGALLQPSDDDSTPLVADTPTTPTNLPLCMNGGYINEASEAETRTRESNRESAPHTPRRHETLQHTDHEVDFRKCGINNIKNSPSANCSRTTSSSSGASSCGAPGSHGSGNNNVPRTEPELRQAPWFQHGIPREIALEVLSSQQVGAFLVRGSTTQAGCYALSVRVPRDFQPSGIAHYLILRTPKGYKIKGFTKEFTSLSALVTHHSVMPELLPVPLLLARGAHAHAHAARAQRREHADIDSVAPPPPPTAHAPHRHAPPHHVANFLAQLDV